MPCLDETEGDSVCVDSVRVPFFCDVLGKVSDGCFGGNVIGLANVAWRQTLRLGEPVCKVSVSYARFFVVKTIPLRVRQS
jgi:hypothetical protein